MDSHNVRIQDAVKVYGDFKAVAGITLDIRKGEFFTPGSIRLRQNHPAKDDRRLQHH